MKIKLYDENSLVGMIDRDFTNWLYGEYDEEKYKQFQFLYGMDAFRPYIDAKLDARAAKEYLYRYGMTWSDIHDPRKLSGTQSGANLYGRTLNWVGKNLHKLYK